MKLLLRLFFTFSTTLAVVGPAASAELLQLERQYRLEFNYPLAFDGRLIYGLEDAGPPFPSHPRLVSVDAADGAKTLLIDGAEYETRPLFFLTNYVVARDGIYNRISLYDRSTWKRTGSMRLAQNVEGATEKGEELFLLQQASSGLVLAKFLLPNMKFLGESQNPELSNLNHAKVIDDRIVGFRSIYCRAPGPCARHEEFELIAVSLEGTEVAKIPLNYEQLQGVSCGQAIIERMLPWRVLIRVECGQYALVDLDQQSVVYNLPRYRSAHAYDMAISGDLIFVRPIANDGRPNTEVIVLDSESGRDLMHVSLPEGPMFATDGKLILRSQGWLARDWSVYSINRAAAIEQNGILSPQP